MDVLSLLRNCDMLCFNGPYMTMIASYKLPESLHQWKLVTPWPWSPTTGLYCSNLPLQNWFCIQKSTFLEVQLGCWRSAWCVIALAQRRSWTDWLISSNLSWCLDLTFPKVYRAALMTISLKAFQCSVISSGGFSTNLLRAVSIQDLKASAHSWCFNSMVFSFWRGLAAFSLHEGLIDRESCNHTIQWSVDYSALCFTLVIWMSEMSLCQVMT